MEQQQEVLKEILRVGQVTADEKRVVLLAQVAKVLSPGELYNLDYLRSQARPNFLSNICTLAPAIKKLGGEKALQDTLLAVRSVCTWWP
jgi:hypothetical protein